MSSSTTPKTISILSLLYDYQHETQIGHDELKSCFWQLTKSRRKSISSSNALQLNSDSLFTADMIREEIYARTRIQNNVNNDNDIAVELIDEDDAVDGDKKETTKQIQAPEWKLYDVLEEKENNATIVKNKVLKDTTSLKSNDDTTTLGLRQRKTVEKSNAKNDESGGDETTTTTTTSSSSSKGNANDENVATASNWTIVQEDDIDDTATERLLLNQDPIELFSGWMPPRDLKLAQERAKLALKHYIDAANHVAAIMTILNRRHENEGKQNHDDEKEEVSQQDK